MALTLDKMKALRPLIEEANAIGAKLGKPPIPQPQPLTEEIKPQGALGTLTRYATNPLGAIGIMPGMERAGALGQKALAESLIPGGFGKTAMEKDLTMRGLQPQGIGEKALVGGTQAAGVLGQVAGLSMIPGLSGLVPMGRAAALGGIYGAESNLAPALEKKSLTPMIKGAFEGTKDFLMFHGMGVLGSKIFSIPYVKNVFTNLIKTKGLDSANRILNMSSRAAQAVVTGLGSAGMTAVEEGARGEDIISSGIVGGAMGAALPGAMKPLVEPPKVQPPVTNPKVLDKTKQLTYDARAKEFASKKATFIKQKATSISEDIHKARVAELLDLAEGKIGTNVSNPRAIAVGWRAMAERARLLGDDPTFYESEAIRAEAMSGQYDALKPAWASLQQKKAKIAETVQKLRQVGEVGKGKLFIEKELQNLAKDYFDSEVQFNTTLDSMYGRHSEGIKSSIDTYFSNPAKAADIQMSIDLENAKIKAGGIPVPSNPVLPKSDVQVDIPLAIQEAKIDLVTDAAGASIIGKAKAADIQNKVAAGVQEIYDAIGGPGIPSKRTKAHATLSDSEVATIDLSARELNPDAIPKNTIVAVVEDITRMITNMLPGGVNNPIALLFKRGIQAGQTGAEMESMRVSGELLGKLKDAGLKIDVEKGIYDKQQTLDFIKWYESNGKILPKAKDLLIFEKAKPLIKEIFDRYWLKLQAWHRAIGKEDELMPYQENYISWLTEYSLTNPYGHMATELPNRFIHPNTQSAWMAKIRGNVAPSQRLDLIQTLQKYIYDVELLERQVKPLHALNRYRDAFNKFAADKDGNQPYIADAPASSKDFRNAANLMQTLADVITGAGRNDWVEKVFRSLASATDSWAGQVITTPGTMFNQALGAPAIVAEAGMRNTSSGFWGELKQVLGNPSKLINPSLDSEAYQARMNGGKHILLDKWAGAPFIWRNTAQVGKIIQAATHYVDLFVVGAAYRAGYAKAKDLGMSHTDAKLYGDYVANITQGAYEKALRPILLQRSVGKVLTPLSTSSFAGANTFRHAAIRDLAKLKNRNLELTNSDVAKGLATAVLLRMALNVVRPSAGKDTADSAYSAVADAISDNMYGLGTISRFGMPGILGVMENIVNAKNAGEFTKNVASIASPMPGTLYMLNLAEFINTMFKGGVVRGKDGDELYRIDPNNAMEISRGILFGQRKTQAFAEHLGKYRTDVLTRTKDIVREYLKAANDLIEGRGYRNPWKNT